LDLLSPKGAITIPQAFLLQADSVESGMKILHHREISNGF